MDSIRIKIIFLIFLLKLLLSESVIYTYNNEVKASLSQIKNNPNLISSISCFSEIDCLAICSKQSNCSSLVYDYANKKGFLMSYFLPDDYNSTHPLMIAFYNNGLF